MITKEHKKHSDLVKPSLGNFGRNEYSITGTICGNIQALADAVIQSLSAKYKCVYVDTDHKDPDAALHTQEAFIAYTDKISYREFRYKSEPDKFQYHQLFNAADLVLVNG